MTGAGQSLGQGPAWQAASQRWGQLSSRRWQTLPHCSSSLTACGPSALAWSSRHAFHVRRAGSPPCVPVHQQGRAAQSGEFGCTVRVSAWALPARSHAGPDRRVTRVRPKSKEANGRNPTCCSSLHSREIVERVQWQGRRTSTWHSGQASGWQASAQGCSQERWRWQGSSHCLQPSPGRSACAAHCLSQHAS